MECLAGGLGWTGGAGYIVPCGPGPVYLSNIQRIFQFYNTFQMSSTLKIQNTILPKSKFSKLGMVADY
jgi:hypothetical protein